ncbi:hypothetical protein [Absidia glauca]|uniref:Uncharacterized protein n=1 Tax=Absidia glauca TaxID=4829 RepID=A0A163J7R7_ABSGL|nr:hypothetical protein [Absidia glauca]
MAASNVFLTSAITTTFLSVLLPVVPLHDPPSGKSIISPFARRTWYHLIHRTWPTSNLHNRISNSDSTAAPVEHTPYMDLDCLSKLGIWSCVWTHYFTQDLLNPNDIWHFLTKQRPTTPLPRHQLLPLFQVAGSTLQVSWRGHRASHFWDVSFVVSVVFGQVVEELSRIRLLCASASKVD